MQELEKILEEIDETIWSHRENAMPEDIEICYGLNLAKDIIRKHMSGKDTDVPTNDGRISVDYRHQFGTDSEGAGQNYGKTGRRTEENDGRDQTGTQEEGEE